MFAGVEEADRRNWLVSPYISSRGNVDFTL
jgi:hypothetical protein